MCFQRPAPQVLDQTRTAGYKSSLGEGTASQRLKADVRYIMSQHGGYLRAQAVTKNVGSGRPGYGKESCKPAWWPKTYHCSSKQKDIEMPWHAEDSKPDRMNNEQLRAIIRAHSEYEIKAQAEGKAPGEVSLQARKEEPVLKAPGFVPAEDSHWLDPAVKVTEIKKELSKRGARFAAVACHNHSHSILQTLCAGLLIGLVCT